MHKIVVIEDDADLFRLLKYNLEKAGFRVAGLQTSEGAIEFCARERPDLILLDILLPGGSDGLDICKAIRKNNLLANVPIIFLTGKAGETDRLVGLEIGANDYVVKPFFISEVIARIKVQLRDKNGNKNSLLCKRGIELDKERRRVLVQEKAIELTATEFLLLECLMRNPDIAMSREQLIQNAWRCREGKDRNREFGDRTVDVYILRLREKLETKNNPEDFISAVRNVGYKFNSVKPQRNYKVGFL